MGSNSPAGDDAAMVGRLDDTVEEEAIGKRLVSGRGNLRFFPALLEMVVTQGLDGVVVGMDGDMPRVILFTNT